MHHTCKRDNYSSYYDWFAHFTMINTPEFIAAKSAAILNYWKSM